MYVVVCGGNDIRKDGHAHATVCFEYEVAKAEAESMESCGYPIKGIFEIESLNIFSDIPRYLKDKLQKKK